MELQNSDLTQNSNHHINAKKASEMYRVKLGLLNKFTFHPAKAKKDETQKLDGKDLLEPQTNDSVQKEDNKEKSSYGAFEMFPEIRDRSNTIDSKRSYSIISRSKQREVVSRRHQAYSLLYAQGAQNNPAMRK